MLYTKYQETTTIENYRRLYVVNCHYRILTVRYTIMTELQLSKISYSVGGCVCACVCLCGVCLCVCARAHVCVVCVFVIL